MAEPVPRVRLPQKVAPDEIFEVHAIISHAMETGLRIGRDGEVVPRRIINRFQCFYNGKRVFAADLNEGMAANPYFSFALKASRSGPIEFVWDEDGGAQFRVAYAIAVS